MSFSDPDPDPDPSPERRMRQAEANAPNGDIRDLFTFQLQRLAGLSTRIAALTMRPRFGVTPREWRILAVLSYLGEAPLQELSRQAGLIKSQSSRTVSGLTRRNLIQRSANPEDGRSVLLKLTPEGIALSREILTASHARNDDMLSALSPAERLMLAELVDRVIATSMDHYAAARLTAPPLNEDDLDD